MLWYIAKLYRQWVNPDAPYKKALVQLPAPHFFVFYNGTTAAPEKWTMRLSDAFAENEHTLELVVTAYNINYAENGELLQKCHDLKCYSIFIDKVREGLATEQTLRQAVTSAIRYCKNNDLLTDYFARKEQEEVFDMVNFKWDWNRAMEVRVEEAVEEATDAKTTEVVINMLKKHYSYEEIMELAGTTKDNITRIAQMNNLAYN